MSRPPLLDSALKATLNGNTVSLAFNLPDKDVDFLAQGETLQITYDVTVHNSGGDAIAKGHRNGDRRERPAGHFDRVRQFGGRAS